MVVGTDIAELLLKNKTDVPPRPSSVISNISSAGEVNPTSEASNHQASETNGSTLSILKEEEVTNKFREFLLYGSGKEALGKYIHVYYFYVIESTSVFVFRMGDEAWTVGPCTILS